MKQMHRIKHVIVIMQENRSFDNYFGTYPGADGFPTKDGHFTECSPDPARGTCVYPHFDSSLIDGGGPHTVHAAFVDMNGGKMNGFMKEAEVGTKGCLKHLHVDAPACDANSVPDVMGYHDARQLPNYWTWAHDFVLQDHMFEPNYGWSLPAHLFMVSAWSARCHDPDNPMTCHTALQHPAYPDHTWHGMPPYGWTDLTYLLYTHHVSWRYYLEQGYEPDCANGEMFCKGVKQTVGTPEIWNPLAGFVDVHQDHQLGNIVPADQFFSDARNGRLPAVSWVVPNQKHSDHPPANIKTGQAWVTSLVDSVMRGPDWNSSAIFIAWDDWGGFYDNVVPPKVDSMGYGLRVAAFMISPYARQGYIDHQILSFDAYLKFIEEDFLGGQMLNPKTDGRPDSRPDVREAEPILGNLLSEFDFNQKPRPPVILPLHPPPGPASHPEGTHP